MIQESKSNLLKKKSLENQTVIKTPGPLASSSQPAQRGWHARPDKK